MSGGMNMSTMQGVKGMSSGGPPAAPMPGMDMGTQPAGAPMKGLGMGGKPGAAPKQEAPR